jgi:hypothetical protein
LSSKETESELDSDAEKKIDESTGKKYKQSNLKFTEVKRWPTCADCVLEPAQISHEIYTLVKKFMHWSRLMQVPYHRKNPTDSGLWNQHCTEYYNSKTDEWI